MTLTFKVLPYLPRLVNVVCERLLWRPFRQMSLVQQHGTPEDLCTVHIESIYINPHLK